MVKLQRIEEIYETLPKNYNFEISKIIRTIKTREVRKVALQFPDGLLKYAFKINSILKNYAKVVLLGDVVYGACCIEDRTSKLLGCDLLVHFGHSCLIPVYMMDSKVLYVHVDIKFDVEHIVNLLKQHFNKQRITILGTIQYNSSVHRIREEVKCKNVDFSKEMIYSNTSSINGIDENTIKNNGIDEDNRIEKDNTIKNNRIDEDNTIKNNRIDEDNIIKNSRIEKDNTIDIVKDNIINTVKDNNINTMEDNKFINEINSIFARKSENNKFNSKKENKLQNTCSDINCKCIDVVVPQAKPLSQGEVLGCTSPQVTTQNVIYIGDGRFHLESVMYQNKNCDFFKYCPYSKIMTVEKYDHLPITATGNVYGIIKGGLGRQGNEAVMNRIIEKLRKDKKLYFFLFDEIKNEHLECYDFIDIFIQTSCPRLSLDWGGCFTKPLLSTYGVFGKENMDFYAKDKY